LTIVRAGVSVVLSWPSSNTNYVLETSSTLGSGANWTLRSGATVAGNNFVLTNNPSGQAAFFRLRQQTP
jgi:hypothetical protein